MIDKDDSKRVKEYIALRKDYFNNTFSFDYALEFFGFIGIYVTRKSLRYLSNLDLIGDFYIAMDETFKTSHPSQFDEDLKLNYSRLVRKSIEFELGLHSTIKKKISKKKSSPKDLKAIRILFGLDGVCDSSTELEKQEFNLIKNELKHYLIGKYGELLAKMYISHYVYGETFADLSLESDTSRQSVHKALSKIHKNVVSYYKEKNVQLSNVNI